MTDFFFDSSALVKRYIQETGSVWVNGIFRSSPSNEVFIAGITSVELIAAITRRARGRTIPLAEATIICTQYRTDLLIDYQVIEISEALLNHAMTLAEIHGLRGYDAVQMAAASQINKLCVVNGLQPIVFVSADSELNLAAQREQLLVDNPNAYR